MINSANVPLLRKCTQIPKSIQRFDEICCFRLQQSNRIHLILWAVVHQNKEMHTALLSSRQFNFRFFSIRTLATIMEQHFGAPLFTSLWQEHFFITRTYPYHASEETILFFSHHTRTHSQTRSAFVCPICLINAFYLLAKLNSSGITWTNFDGLLNSAHFAFKRSSADWESRLLFFLRIHVVHVFYPLCITWTRTTHRFQCEHIYFLPHVRF